MPDGIPVGRLMVNMNGERDKETGKHIPVYYYESPLVNKMKGSARASRDCRDSISIKGLIASTKKSGDMPSSQALLKHFIRGISYAFGATLRDTRPTHLSLDQDELLALVLSHLELDKNSVKIYDENIKAKYKDYVDSQVKAMQSNTVHNRFCEGSYLIGVVSHSLNGVDRLDKPYYLVGEVSTTSPQPRDYKDFIFHAPLKRYSSLMDCPEIAPHVPIIAAWASGMKIGRAHV